MTFHFLERLPPSLLFYSVSVNANSMVRLIGLAFLMVHPVEEISSMDFMKHVEVFYFYGPALDILLLTYIHTYLHSHSIPEGAAEASQTLLREAHVLPKLVSCD
jgi:hypothetical protein